MFFNIPVCGVIFRSSYQKNRHVTIESSAFFRLHREILIPGNTGTRLVLENFPYDGIDQTTFAVFTRAPVHLSFHSYLAPLPQAKNLCIGEFFQFPVT